MRIQHLGTGIGLAILFSAAAVCRLPEPPSRSAVARPIVAPRPTTSLPSASAPPAAPSVVVSSTDANDEVEYAKDDLDEDAELESALLTLIRARGRGTDARR